MKQLVILLTISVMLAPRVEVSAAQLCGMQLLQVEGSSGNTYEDRLRSFAENALGLGENEVEEFVDAASVIASFLGANLSDEAGGYGAGFGLIIVLFILLVIIGVGFGVES